MFPSDQSFRSDINKLELYPRRRATEFYYERQPLEEHQSRQVEHPQDKLQNRSDEKDKYPPAVDNVRIVPARNSEMRMCRNSYFS